MDETSSAMDATCCAMDTTEKDTLKTAENTTQVDKIIFFVTRTPERGRFLSSKMFSCSGLDWKVTFHYYDGRYYHVLYIHQVIDGKIRDKIQDLGQTFYIKIYLADMEHELQNIGPIHTVEISKTEQMIWYSGMDHIKLYQTLPWLYDRPSVTFLLTWPNYLSNAQKYSTSLTETVPPVQHKMVCEIQEDKIVQTPDIAQDVSSVTKVAQEIIVNEKSYFKEVVLDFDIKETDFSLLLEQQVLPDLRIHSGDQSMRVHRCVLASRSEVFRDIFQKEETSKLKTIKISDVKKDIFIKLLSFLYTGAVNLSEECAADLFDAACKYSVPDLIEACSRWILRKVTVENCLKYLKLAHVHSVLDLKTALISFMINHDSMLKS